MRSKVFTSKYTPHYVAQRKAKEPVLEHLLFILHTIARYRIATKLGGNTETLFSTNIATTTRTTI
jgi:hypothetical protein